ncbi:M23 family metallopeptidase [Mycetocola zhadangensis]|uniref:M23 family metallopeptidase n=1 Tax=Mycetocola zhadangensis TaxID=1164595 RepID=UPI003A4D7DFE
MSNPLKVMSAPGGMGKNRGSRLAARLAALAVVPALFGTMTLPAFATPGTTATDLIGAPDAQSLIVGSEVTASTVQRDSYSATTKEELQAAAAAAAAAASRARSGSASTYNDANLASFLGNDGKAWQRPVAASPTSDYGPRRIICNSAGCSNGFHDGVDLGTSCGTPIRAVSAGRVVFVGSAGSYGNRVIVDHGGGVESIYGHVQGGSYQVSTGDLIEAGTLVANVGRTGVVTDCVLDLKIRINGSFTNPVPFLAARGVDL